MRGISPAVRAAILSLLLSGCLSSLEEEFAELKALAFGDALVQALDARPLVAVGENHGHVELYGPEAVDDIVVEFATSQHQALLDRFIAGKPVQPEDLSKVWRDTVSSLNR